MGVKSGPGFFYHINPMILFIPHREGRGVTVKIGRDTDRPLYISTSQTFCVFVDLIHLVCLNNTY